MEVVLKFWHGSVGFLFGFVELSKDIDQLRHEVGTEVQMQFTLLKYDIKMGRILSFRV